MSKVKIYNAPAVKNMPWQERPEGEFTGAPIWRYKENPIIGRNPLKGVARIFNSALSLTVMSLSVYSAASRPMESLTFTWDTAKMQFTGILMKTRLIS